MTSSINIFLIFIFSTFLLFKLTKCQCLKYWEVGCIIPDNPCCRNLYCTRTLINGNFRKPRHQCLEQPCKLLQQSCNTKDDRCCYGLKCQSNSNPSCVSCKLAGESCNQESDCCIGICASETNTCLGKTKQN
uniref:Uncharacterized protein n=1 Tax=Meloidogyne floridensis TaxID=298350 RepID=A0A915P3J6_9BILA